MYQEALDVFRLQISRLKLSVVTSLCLCGSILHLDANGDEVCWFVLNLPECLGCGRSFSVILKGLIGQEFACL